MPKRPAPVVTIVHHKVQPPKYTPDELAGLKEQSLRLAKHIDILEEEIKLKKSELAGINSILD